MFVGLPETTRKVIREGGMMEKCQSRNCGSTYDLVNVNPDGRVVLLCMLCRTELRWREKGGGGRLEVVK